MARQRISEYRAKHLLSDVFGRPYTGFTLDATTNWRHQLAGLDPSRRYVVKVDQATKRRFQQGLVRLDVPASEVESTAAELMGRGYRYCLVEEYTPHTPESERYLALKRHRDGTALMYGKRGGVDVEDQPDAVRHEILTDSSATAAAEALDLPTDAISQLHDLFNQHHLALLEINPLAVDGEGATPLDAAVEVDDAATNLVGDAWGPADFRAATGAAAEETAVDELNSRSPASFNLQVLNPDGQIFVLLSGGGASLVLADEITHQGAGSLLGNYGEYSGNPSADEVQAYTAQVLSLLLHSRSAPKVLIIAGGVANFTNIATTFSGLIRALAAAAPQLRDQGVSIFVRRGGPQAAEGLQLMRDFLASEGLNNLVAGPELPLADLITAALASLTSAARP